MRGGKKAQSFNDLVSEYSLLTESESDGEKLSGPIEYDDLTSDVGEEYPPLRFEPPTYAKDDFDIQNKSEEEKRGNAVSREGWKLARLYDSHCYAPSQKRKLLLRQKNYLKEHGYRRYSVDSAPPPSGLFFNGEAPPLIEDDLDGLSTEDFYLIDQPLSSDVDYDLNKDKSTFFQSLFNGLNVLLGIGILSLPYAMRVSGMLPAIVISFVFALITNHTAKLLGHCLDSRPGLNSYSDIGHAAFGNGGRVFISIIFFFELFVCCIALIILAGETLAEVVPMSPVLLKVIVFAIVLPMTFLKNLSYLAFASIFGIVSTFLLIGALIAIGFGALSSDVPGDGNLLHPMETQYVASPVSSLPLAFGLIMSGYAGHPVFPSIYRDMDTPSQYPKLVNSVYVIVTIAYTTAMIIGYLMYGLEVDSMVQINLTSTPTTGVSHTVIEVLLWLIGIIPITKFALMANPINLTLEGLVIGDTPYGMTIRQNLIRIGLRTATALGVLIVAIVYPDFESVMALLGAFFSFTVCVLFPIACTLRLYGVEEPNKKQQQFTIQDNPSSENSSTFKLTPFTRKLNIALFVFSFCTAVTGTAWAIMVGIDVFAKVPSYSSPSPTPAPSE